LLFVNFINIATLLFLVLYLLILVHLFFILILLHPMNILVHILTLISQVLCLLEVIIFLIYCLLISCSILLYPLLKILYFLIQGLNHLLFLRCLLVKFHLQCTILRLKCPVSPLNIILLSSYFTVISLQNFFRLSLFLFDY